MRITITLEGHAAAHAVHLAGEFAEAMNVLTRAETLEEEKTAWEDLDRAGTPLAGIVTPHILKAAEEAGY